MDDDLINLADRTLTSLSVLMGLFFNASIDGLKSYELDLASAVEALGVAPEKTEKAFLIYTNIDGVKMYEFRGNEEIAKSYCRLIIDKLG